MPCFSQPHNATVLSKEKIVMKCCAGNINSTPSVRKDEQTTLQITFMEKLQTLSNSILIFRSDNVKHEAGTKGTQHGDSKSRDTRKKNTSGNALAEKEEWKKIRRFITRS